MAEEAHKGFQAARADALVQQTIQMKPRQAELLYDPEFVVGAEVLKPMSQYKGGRVTLRDVASCCIKGRDWFRYWHRADAHLWWWENFYRSYARLTPEQRALFEWVIRMIVGRYGAGKSTASNLDNIIWGIAGFPVFHNGQFLGGWLVEGADLVTCMVWAPLYAKICWDEAHTITSRQRGQATAVGTAVDLIANIRKGGLRLDVTGAQYQRVHQQVLNDVDHALFMRDERPSLDESSLYELTGADDDENGRPPEWDDPTHFFLLWDEYHGSPFQSDEVRKNGFRNIKPSKPRQYIDGNEARLAYALTDSFLRMDSGNLLVRSQDVKDKMESLRSGSDTVQRRPFEQATIEAIGKIYHETNRGERDETEFITAGELSAISGYEPAMIGRAISPLGITLKKGKGYPADALLKAWQREVNKEAQ